MSSYALIVSEAITCSLVLYNEQIDELVIMEITEANGTIYTEVLFMDGQRLISETTSVVKWVKNGWHIIGEL